MEVEVRAKEELVGGGGCVEPPLRTPRPLGDKSGVRALGEAVDESFEPVPDANFPEVDQQAEPVTRELEVGEHLLPMNGRETPDRLQLHEYQPLNDKIGAKALIERYALKRDGGGTCRATWRPRCRSAWASDTS